MKSRRKLEQEYEKLRLSEPRTDTGLIEKVAVMQALQWILWGHGESPSTWIEHGNKVSKGKARK